MTMNSNQRKVLWELRGERYPDIVYERYQALCVDAEDIVNYDTDQLFALILQEQGEDVNDR